MYFSGSTHGTAVFVRTDTFEPSEYSVPFKTLDEMALLCGTPRDNMTLEKIVLHRGTPPRESSTVTLGFIAAVQREAIV
jgi:hypothetical protein